MKLEYNRIVDLTHVLTPGEGAGGKERKLETHMKFVEEVVTGIKRKDDDDWYIMHDVELMNHIGSHIEVPYHYFKDGDDLSEISLERLIGEACIIDITHKGPKEAISRAELEDMGPDLRAGDMALFNTGYSKYWGTERYTEAPYLANDAIRWLVDKDVKLVGSDSWGLQNPHVAKKEEEKDTHQLLLGRGILILENVANLDHLSKERVFVFCLPISIKNLDSFPVRMIALE